MLGEVADSAAAAEQAGAGADAARAAARRTLDDVTARQARIEAGIADHRAQYDALSASQQQEVVAAHTGQAGPPRHPHPRRAVSRRPPSTRPWPRSVTSTCGCRGLDAFGCSGPTQYAHAAAGVSLPHSSRRQSTTGTAVSRADLQPGGLLRYDSPVGHVSMYPGNGQMAHASTSGRPVEVVGGESMGGITAVPRIA